PDRSATHRRSPSPPAPARVPARHEVSTPRRRARPAPRRRAGPAAGQRPAPGSAWPAHAPDGPRPTPRPAGPASRPSRARPGSRHGCRDQTPTSGRSTSRGAPARHCAGSRLARSPPRSSGLPSAGEFEDWTHHREAGLESQTPPSYTGGMTTITRPCSIADTLGVIGEKYSLLVLREIFFGVRRFDAIPRNIAPPRDGLAARLRPLVEAGLLEKAPYNERPPRFDYRLTAAGRELRPVLLMLMDWGDRHLADHPPVVFQHTCRTPPHATGLLPPHRRRQPTTRCGVPRPRPRGKLPLVDPTLSRSQMDHQRA